MERNCHELSKILIIFINIDNIDKNSELPSSYTKATEAQTPMLVAGYEQRINCEERQIKRRSKQRPQKYDIPICRGRSR